jgi:hypothetical protein
MLVLALAACRAPWDPAKAKQAEADARQILLTLQEPDLAKYRERSLPPAEWRNLQRDWPKIRRKMALSESEQKNFNKWLLRFTEAQAEAHLQRDLNAKIKPLKSEIDDKWPLMQASLTLLLQGWIESNAQLNASEKAHGKALIKAIIEQMPPEWLLDVALRERAFTQMAAIARETGVTSYQDYSSLQYADYHRLLSGFIGGLKELGKVYGFDWNAEQARLQIKAVKQSGNTATVMVRYPLGEKWVEFPMDLMEYDGRWYDASAVKWLRASTPPLP